MRRLSSPIAQLQNHYAVVVVGSGYGGGIAASRLARAGQTVCVLERGREFQPGEYPDTLAEMTREAQLDTPQVHIGTRTGLYDFRFNDDINVFLGCGLGGTSLVNANVSLPPERRVLEDPRWPQALRNDIDTQLAEGFRRATDMLKPLPYPANHPTPPKLEALEQSSTEFGGHFSRPPINVTFTDGVNHVGVEQHTCVLCGDCVSGCNHGAKNTVLMNYLPDARNHGAEIYTEVSVRRLERVGDQWRVHYQLVESGREAFDAPTLSLTADLVVLAAGTLGSTEILLRSKAAGLAASDRTGFRFTGNGDALGFSYNTDENINAVGFGDRDVEGREPVGPCISGLIDLRNQPNLDDGMVIEEGAIPGAMGGALPAGLGGAAGLVGQDPLAGGGGSARRRPGGPGARKHGARTVSRGGAEQPDLSGDDPRRWGGSDDPRRRPCSHHLARCGRAADLREGQRSAPGRDASAGRGVCQEPDVEQADGSSIDDRASARGLCDGRTRGRRRRQ